jgi:demethylmenaquinone methyltransferase/2-methoxy-6-polyprenyl-1,4-benzoquinol methylase
MDFGNPVCAGNLHAVRPPHNKNHSVFGLSDYSAADACRCPESVQPPVLSLMSSGYFAPGPERAEKVRKLFRRIAGNYDLINDLQSFGLHRAWKRRLAFLAAAGNGARVLDLCCGTGDMGRLLSAGGARVVGCDFTREMLAAAPPANRGQSFVQGDALHLPFKSGSFDVATIAYGLRNLASFEQGLVEMRRILKPGGRLLILDFGRPSNRPWRFLYFTYLRTIVPVFGLLFAQDAAAYRYILDSLENYPAQDGVSRLLLGTGWNSVAVENFLGGVMSIHWAVAGPSA